jgi:two-component system C4-dicarboxylate transport sensor histidine kinase DctB
VGLGLAISSGIMSDFGGRLTARNGSPHGAVFEMQLPILGQSLAQDLKQDVKAAE